MSASVRRIFRHEVEVSAKTTHGASTKYVRLHLHAIHWHFQVQTTKSCSKHCTGQDMWNERPFRIQHTVSAWEVCPADRHVSEHSVASFSLDAILCQIRMQFCGSLPFKQNLCKHCTGQDNMYEIKSPWSIHHCLLHIYLLGVANGRAWFGSAISELISVTILCWRRQFDIKIWPAAALPV